jgi:hypothetical protein
VKSSQGKGHRTDPKGRAERSTAGVMLRGLKTVTTLRRGHRREVVSLRGSKVTARRHARKRQSTTRRLRLMAAGNRPTLHRIAGAIGLFLLVALLISGCSTATIGLNPAVNDALRLLQMPPPPA